MNVHATYYDTAYADWDRVVASIRALGLTHARDTLLANPEAADANEVLYARYEQAARQGIRFDLIAGAPNRSDGTPAQLVAAAARLRRAIATLEGPNELDNQGLEGWARQLQSYQRTLYAAVRADERLNGVPVVGPSLVGDEHALGSLRGALDLGNSHPYTGGEPPTRNRITGELEDSRVVSGDAPVLATEAGFHNALNASEGQPAVPEDVAAAYVLRTYLVNFAAGVRGTFMYELIDEQPEPGLDNPEEHFGLLRNDFSEKPAAVALRRLSGLLGERRAPGRLEQLDYSVEGDGIEQLLLQRADGHYLLILWPAEASAWDTGARAALPTDLMATVRLREDATIAIHRPVLGDGRQRLGSARRWKGRVGAGPVVLEISRE